MGDTIEKAVERAIVAMRDNLGEPLTVDDIARAANFSKFHFTRVFQRVTGVSPGRFLSALRLQQARRLLLSTSLNVADISMRVGYNSVGTFSARFSRSVGLSPTAYRRLCGYSGPIELDISRDALGVASGVVAGHVIVPPTVPPTVPPGPIFMGLFPGRIAEGRPVQCAILDRPGPFRLEKVPAGSWYLLAQSGPERADDATVPVHGGEQGLSVASHGPIVVGEDTAIETIDLRLAPMRSLDPPVLLALHDIRRAARDRAARDRAATAARGWHDMPAA